MKEVKVIIIATIVTCLLILSCAYAMPVHAEEAEELPEFYCKLTIVVEKEAIGDLWIISCRDKNGQIWSFYDDIGEWNIGDIANLFMWNMNENEEEHEIIEVYWEGYTENVDMFLKMMGWC